MSDSAAGPGRARFRLMGGFRLAGSDGRTVAVASRRARGLLAYLVFAREQAATRERLRGLLWTDRGEPQARASLRQCLLELRAILDSAGLDLIEAGRETVALKPGAAGSDVAELESALAGEDTSALVAALASMGAGRLLEDLEIGGLFRDWLDQTRAGLDQSIATDVLTHLKRLEADAAWPKVRALAEAYLRRDPMDEATVAAAIRADVALGNTTLAHRRFQVLQAALAKEFGVSPGATAREALVAAPGEAFGARAITPSPLSPPLEAHAGLVAPPLVILAMFESSFSDGAETGLAATLREEVLSGLSRFHDLRVITDPRPLDLVVSDLPVERAGAYALGASLRSGGDERRLIVQLLASGERHVIWAERFALPGLDIVGTIDDIIARVVGAVLPTISADLMRAPSNLPVDGAFERYLLIRGPDVKPKTFEEARAAADRLEAMLSANPAVILPYLPLAHLYNTDFAHSRAGSSGPAERARALELAKAALALDRGNARGYTVAGWCYLRRRQWAPARLHLEQALSLNPFHVRRVMEVGYGLLFLGDLEKARALFDRCFLLSPSPEDGFFMDLGLLALIRGDHELASSYFDLMADPEIWGQIYSAINARMAKIAAPDKSAAARDRIAAIWPAETPMTVDAIVAWIADHHPFQAPEVAERFLSAARLTFG